MSALLHALKDFFYALSPHASSQAQAIHSIFTKFLILAGIIFLLVTTLVIVAIIRFRAKDGDGEPKQVFGNRRLEIAWTVIPGLVVFYFFFITVKAMLALSPGSLESSDPDLIITAHQWWWELHYPHYGVVAANEVHIPTGKRLLARVESADVVHDWWVPALGPKIDAVPGRKNYTWIEADKPGVYQGACAEFCGAQHAWMRIRVVAHPPVEFEQWIRVHQQTPPEPAVGLAADGAKIFQAKTCVNCHAVSGTAARSTVGPDLSHFASRKTILSGMLENNHQNLTRWLSDPQKVKPGAHMPNFLFTSDEVKALAAYLEELK